MNLTPYILLSSFVGEMIFTLLLDTNKATTRGYVDSLYEIRVGGHQASQGIKHWMDVDVSKILTALNLIESPENSQVIHWCGPDF